MTEIRTKDKLFLAAVVPLALIAAYWHGWRNDAVKRLANLEVRHATLVSVDAFPAEKARAEKARAAAFAELDEEKSRPMPQTKVKADAKASAAERERAVLDVFRASSLTVAKSADAAGNGARNDMAANLLVATGARPNPVRRAYTLDGDYPNVVRALETFSEKEMAVVPDGISMRPSGRNRWTVEVWQ